MLSRLLTLELASVKRRMLIFLFIFPECQLPMKSLLLHNLGLKLASVFLAVLIWLVVHMKMPEKPILPVKLGKIVPVQKAP